MNNEICFWKLDDPEMSIWISSCGEEFSFIDYGPLGNGFVFCPYCGLKLNAEDDGSVIYPEFEYGY